MTLEERALNKEADGQTHMLMQVIEVHRRECIISGVEVGCRVHHVLITDVCGGVASVVCSTTVNVSTEIMKRCSRITGHCTRSHIGR